MILILEQLFKEIEHGDKEHRQWLYDKMEEFSNKLNANMSETRELTFGEKAVGITFNPGQNEHVKQIKEMYADLIDRLNNLRTHDENPEKKRMYSVAITEAQSSQMWAVKAITWQY